jgi:adenylate kinase
MPETLKRERSTWLKGPNAACATPPMKQAHPRRFVLLGAPGIGKGTQADLLARQFGACQLSTGDIFRAAKIIPEAEQTPALHEAIVHMRAGKLVPDTTVIALVEERVACLHCDGGFLLDGFPRTVAQAEALDRILAHERVALDAVISYDLSEEKVLDRVSGRRVCSKCKVSYHLQHLPPKVAGVCDRCGGPLYQREDDRPEAVHVRMEVYLHSTEPLIEYYQEQGKLVHVDCGDTPAATFQRTLAALKITV